MSTYSNFEEYLQDQSEEARKGLQKLRKLILQAAPEAEELINYNIPAFSLVPGGKRDQQIMIAGFRKHLGLYPHPLVMEAFEDELTAYRKGKGSVQFPLRDPLPAELILRMVRFRKDQLDKN